MTTAREIIRESTPGFSQVAVTKNDWDHIVIQKGIDGIESSIHLTTQDAQALLIVLGEKVLEAQGFVTWTREQS